MRQLQPLMSRTRFYLYDEENDDKWNKDDCHERHAVDDDDECGEERREHAQSVVQVARYHPIDVVNVAREPENLYSCPQTVKKLQHVNVDIYYTALSCAHLRNFL